MDLVVISDADNLPALSEALLGLPAAWAPVVCEDVRAGILRVQQPGVAVLVVALHPAKALWVLQECRHLDLGVPTLLIVSRSDERFEREARALGADECLVATETSAGLLGRVLRHVVDLSVQRQALSRAAREDALTGLLNRHGLRDLLPERIRYCERSNSRLAVLVLDIDRFREANEHGGHTAGDLLLREFAQRLRSQVRPGDLCARVSADEFVVVLGDYEEGYTPQEVASRIRAMTTHPLNVNDEEYLLTASIGIASFPETVGNPEQLLQDAELAMQAARAGGGNRYIFFSRGMQEEAKQRQDLRQALSRALDEEEFRLVYQPMVAPETGELLAVEALLRWEHPERGCLLPEAFLSSVEAVGISRQLSHWVLGQVLADAQRWKQAGLPAVKFAFNFSARQLRQPSLLPFLTRSLEKTPLEPSLLELELPESVCMEMHDSNRSLLGMLRTMGLSLTMDGFGSGLSSLSYLKHFPLNQLKLDRGLVQNLEHDPRDYLMAEAIVRMAKGLRIGVVAVGVETEGQLEMVLRLGVERVQGFLTGRPGSLDLLMQAAGGDSSSCRA